MLLSYALNPTHSTQSLPDIAARHGQPQPTTLASAAAAIHALVPVLRAHVDDADLTRIYTEIDLPLAPVLYRMEQAGVSIDTTVLHGLSERFAVELQRVGERIFELSNQRFNINSPKQLGVVLFTHLGLPAPLAEAKIKQYLPRKMYLNFSRRSMRFRAWFLNTVISPSSSRITLTHCRCWPTANHA